jgi:hypothetical protein
MKLIHTHQYSDLYDPPMPVREVVLHNPLSDPLRVAAQALIDSGADATMVPEDLLRQIDAIYVDTLFIRGVTGVRERVNLFAVDVHIGVEIIPNIYAVAMKPETELILGRDVINNLIVSLNGLAQVVEVSS